MLSIDRLSQVCSFFDSKGEVIKFIGQDHCAHTTAHYDAWKRNFYIILGSKNIQYVTDDDQLFGPGRYPDADEEPPQRLPLQEMPENATFDERQRVLEYNLNVNTAHEASSKAYFQRKQTGDTALVQALSLLQMNLEPQSPASVIVDNAIKNETHPYRRYTIAIDALDKKWLHHLNSTTAAEVFEDLKQLTDSFHKVAQRNALWITKTDLLSRMDSPYTEQQLFDVYCKGVNNPHLQLFVLQHQRSDTTEKTWIAMALELARLVEIKPEIDTEPLNEKPAPVAQGPTKTVAMSVNTQQPNQEQSARVSQPNHNATRFPGEGDCAYCGRNGHSYKECQESSCVHCHRDLPNQRARKEHFGAACPIREKIRKPSGGGRKDGNSNQSKKRNRTDGNRANDSSKQKKRNTNAFLVKRLDALSKAVEDLKKP
jgi:hypothetical protein